MSEKIKRLLYDDYQNMNNTSYPRGVFYVRSGDDWVGVDNQNGAVADETFDELHECLDWLRERMKQ